MLSFHRSGVNFNLYRKKGTAVQVRTGIEEREQVTPACSPVVSPQGGQLSVLGAKGRAGLRGFCGRVPAQRWDSHFSVTSGGL